MESQMLTLEFHAGNRLFIGLAHRVQSVKPVYIPPETLFALAT